MSTLHTIARAGLALSIPLGLAFMPTSATAAEFPADWQPISAADQARLADLGIRATYQGSRVFYLEKARPDADFVISGGHHAIEQGVFPAMPSGSQVDVFYPGAVTSHGSDLVPVNSVAHASYYEGGRDANVAMTWLLDDALSEIPADQLVAAGLKPHADNLSDCVVNTCGITIAPAVFHEADPEDWESEEYMETTADSIFIPITYSPIDANGLEYTDWDGRDVTWSATPGRVEGTYSGTVTGFDGLEYHADFTATVVGGIAADAPWYSSGWSGVVTGTPCGDATGPRECFGIGQDAGLLNSDAEMLSTSVDYDMGALVAPPVVPPVSVPPVSVPPVVEPPVAPPVEPPLSDEPPVTVPTPSTPPVVEPQPEVASPLIPERVNSGGGYSSPMSSVAAVGALLAAVGSALVSRRRTVKVAR